MIKPGLHSCDQPLATRHDVAMVDLDGVCYHGAQPIRYAAESLADAQECGLRVGFVTNNASRTPHVVAGQLNAMGIEVNDEQILTASQAAAAVVAGRFPAGSPILYVGAEGLRVALEEVGLVPVTGAGDRPVAVVQGYGPEVGWSDLAEAAYAISGGAQYFATNLDLTLPTERGQAPGNGALVAAVVAATGVEPSSSGKPSPAIFERAAERWHASNPLSVGDRLDTDLAGAREAGYPGLHVLTGVHGAIDVALAPPAWRPAYVAQDLRGLLQTHPVPERTATEWRCRLSAARIVDGRLELLTVADRMDALRAAYAACWAHQDDGGSLSAADVAVLGTI